MTYTLTAWTTLAALAIYLWTGMNAAKARVTFGIKAPQMDGPVDFMSIQRVQANTLEQLPLLLAPMWMCAALLGDRWAAAGGLLWCVGRVVYALAYYKDPGKRTAGFTVAVSASGLLMLGTVVGLLMQ
jgi:glutathione S-transferase